MKYNVVVEVILLENWTIEAESEDEAREDFECGDMEYSETIKQRVIDVKEEK